LKKKSEAAG